MSEQKEVPYAVIQPLRDRLYKLKSLMKDQYDVVLSLNKQLSDQNFKLGCIEKEIREVANFLDTCDNAEDYEALVETWIANLDAK